MHAKGWSLRHNLRTRLSDFFFFARTLTARSPGARQSDGSYSAHRLRTTYLARPCESASSSRRPTCPAAERTRQKQQIRGSSMRSLDLHIGCRLPVQASQMPSGSAGPPGCGAFDLLLRGLRRRQLILSRALVDGDDRSLCGMGVDRRVHTFRVACRCLQACRRRLLGLARERCSCAR